MTAAILYLLVAAAAAGSLNANESKPLIVRYLRHEGGLEAEIRIDDDGMRRTVTSTTPRGPLRIKATYQAGKLSQAEVVVGTGANRKSARATASNGKVVIVRSGLPQLRLDCPDEVIVTSAPDWTDAIFICSKYDLKKQGTQQFAGLWIHPSKDPLRLTFSAELRGFDVATVKGQRVPLARLAIRLRNDSRYIAWRSPDGKMVRLVPAGRPKGGIVLEGWQDWVAHLKP
ncbi:MAG: hypothetical protein KatS3mg105_0521 [Gemmatales bacterium]|nr:MAG: hypothetical protein KatS3mg105_0521 [Gemmatales bacterium]